MRATRSIARPQCRESSTGGFKEGSFSFSLSHCFIVCSSWQEIGKRHDSHLFTESRFHWQMLGSARAIKDIIRSWRWPWSRGRSAIASGRRLVRRATSPLPLTAATSPPALYLDKDIFDVRLDHPIADDAIKTGSGACDLCGSVRQGR